MKIQRFCLYIILGLTILLNSCATSPDKLIIGEWKGTDHTGETASLVFYKDASAKMIRSNMVFNSSSVGGKLIWRIDDRHDPMHLDLVLIKASDETKIIPMIVRFISDTKIQLRMNDDMSSRPIEFSDSDEVNQIILTKQ